MDLLARRAIVERNLAGISQECDILGRQIAERQTEALRLQGELRLLDELMGPPANPHPAPPAGAEAEHDPSLPADVEIGPDSLVHLEDHGPAPEPQPERRDGPPPPDPGQDSLKALAPPPEE